MITPFKNAFLALCALGTLSATGHAAISVAASATNPNDLVITIHTPVTIVLTGEEPEGDQRWGLRLNGVYSTAQSNLLLPGESTATLTLAGETSTGIFYENGVIAWRETTGHDLVFYWTFDENVPVAASDTFTISAGTFTIPGYLASGNLPDWDQSTVSVSVINAWKLTSLGDAVVGYGAIPEPSSLLALGLSGGLLMARRRR